MSFLWHLNNGAVVVLSFYAVICIDVIHSNTFFLKDTIKLDDSANIPQTKDIFRLSCLHWLSLAQADLWQFLFTMHYTCLPRQTNKRDAERRGCKHDWRKGERSGRWKRCRALVWLEHCQKKKKKKKKERGGLDNSEGQLDGSEWAANAVPKCEAAHQCLELTHSDNRVQWGYGAWAAHLAAYWEGSRKLPPQSFKKCRVLISALLRVEGIFVSKQQHLLKSGGLLSLHRQLSSPDLLSSKEKKK